MEGVSIKFIKLSLFFFNLLFWLSGTILIIVGSIIRKKYGAYFSYADHKFATAELFIIVVGVIVFLIGFLGCCGAIKENYCMVTAFSILLSIVFILEVVTGAVGFAYKEKVKIIASDALHEAVDSYNMRDDGKNFLDWAQVTLACCGSTGPADYNGRKGNMTTSPCGAAGEAVASCHEGGHCQGVLYKSGCKKKFADFIRRNLIIIGTVAVAVAVVQLFGIIFACFLMKAFRRDLYRAV